MLLRPPSGCTWKMPGSHGFNTALAFKPSIPCFSLAKEIGPQFMIMIAVRIYRQCAVLFTRDIRYVPLYIWFLPPTHTIHLKIVNTTAKALQVSTCEFIELRTVLLWATAAGGSVFQHRSFLRGAEGRMNVDNSSCQVLFFLHV